MDSDTPAEKLGDATVGFEQALEGLVLEAYADGVEVKGAGTSPSP